MKYKIFDNFLEKSYFKKLEETLTGNNFPWYINGVVDNYDVNNYNEEYNSLHNIHMTHLFYRDHAVTSNYYELVYPIVMQLNPKALIRIQANINTVQEKNIEHGYHIDYPNCTSAILYINTNNGYTNFKNGTKINPVKNRMAIFDSNNLHSGASCTDSRYKCIINFCYIEEENGKYSVL